MFVNSHADGHVWTLLDPFIGGLPLYYWLQASVFKHSLLDSGRWSFLSVGVFSSIYNYTDEFRFVISIIGEDRIWFSSWVFFWFIYLEWRNVACDSEQNHITSFLKKCYFTTCVMVAFGDYICCLDLVRVLLQCSLKDYGCDTEALYPRIPHTNSLWSEWNVPKSFLAGAPTRRDKVFPVLYCLRQMALFCLMYQVHSWIQRVFLLHFQN